MLPDGNIRNSTGFTNQAAFSQSPACKDYVSPHLVQVAAMGNMRTISVFARLSDLRPEDWGLNAARAPSWSLKCRYDWVNQDRLNAAFEDAGANANTDGHLNRTRNYCGGTEVRGREPSQRVRQIVAPPVRTESSCAAVHS